MCGACLCSPLAKSTSTNSCGVLVSASVIRTLRVQVDIGWPKIFIVMRPLLAWFCGTFVGFEVTIVRAFCGNASTRRAIESAGESLPHAASPCDIAGDEDRAAVSRPGLATGRHGPRPGARVRGRAADLRGSRRRAGVRAVAAVLRRPRR